MVLDFTDYKRTGENKMDETKEKLIKYKEGERKLIQERLKLATELKRRERK